MKSKHTAGNQSRVNRWNAQISIGDRVSCNHPRGGTFDGTVSRFEFMRGYGWRVVLDSGMSAGIDDCRK